MTGTKIPPVRPRRRDRFSTQKQTAISPRAVNQLQIQTLDCLHGGRIEELRGILTNFVEHNKIENLARNFDDIIRKELSPIHSLRKFVDLLREIMGGKFHLLFIEFSKEAQAKIVGQIRMREDGLAVTAGLLDRLIIASERKPDDKNILQAAAQLVSPGTVHYYLNNYVIEESGEKRLSLVYLIKYRESDEIEPVISQALSDYSKCGPQATRKGANALQAFRRIMEGFRNLSIQAQLS